MSIHRCEVIEVKLEEHPNADSLSMVKAFGYDCAVRTDDWTDGDLAVYIPPDSLVSDTEPFQFLKRDSRQWNRIRVKRLRGYISQGLLVPAPDGSKIGDDVMEQMGITHYEPPEPMSFGGDNEKGPSGYYPKYNVENFNSSSAQEARVSLGQMLSVDDEVVVTEKLHGASARYVFSEDRMWVASRTSWKKEEAKNVYWKGLVQNPWIEEWCRAHPGLVVYGEIFGQVQDLKYGATKNQIKFAAFDILDKDRWLDFDEAQDIGRGLTWVPFLYRGKFDEEKIRQMAETDSSICGADHLSEGIVVKPVVERKDLEIGRVLLKIVSNRYYLR